MDALQRAEELVREAEGAADRKDGPAAARTAWQAVQVLKEARQQASPEEREKARARRSPLYLRAVRAALKAEQWGEARKLANHVRFDRDARQADRAALGQAVAQASRELKVAGPPDECDLV